MSVLISGALINGAGIPMSGCHIILKSRVNTSEVVMRTIADVVTGTNGEYSFEAQTGKYCVYLKQDWRDECCVGDIAVYDDSRPGTLNDFLTALDEGDLKPDVVKRFEEMVAQAQQSAEAAAESEQQAGQHVADAQQIKSDCQTLADNVQQNAEAVAEDKNQVALLASSAAQDAARAEQAASDADKAVQKAVDKLADAATLTGEAKASAEAAAQSEQNAKNHADNAAESARQTVQDVEATTTARSDAERFAEAARQDAVATAEDRNVTAENAISSEQSAQAAASFASAAEEAKNKIEESLEFTSQDIINILSGVATETAETWYGVGSIVLAAYNGAGSGDTSRKIKRGDSYPGSRLGAVEFTCYGTNGTGYKLATVSVYVRGADCDGMPGTYRALSGDEVGSAGSSSVMIGLFIRIA